MILLLEIIEVQNKLGNGSTIPYVVWCNDGNRYVVKFPGNPQGTKSLTNEYIASRMAKLLGLPIMDFSLIKVKKENYSDDMKQEMDSISGTAFGTIYDDKLLTVLNPDEIIKSSNRNDAIKILIFDMVMGNYDRNQGNLMVNSSTKKIIMIDHTHIFGLGTIWDQYQLPRYIDMPFEIEKLHPYNYTNLIESINYNTEFYNVLKDFCHLVKTISVSDIMSIMEDIPNDWHINNKEKELLTQYIITRFGRINEILELLDIKGGDNSEN